MTDTGSTSGDPALDSHALARAVDKAVASGARRFWSDVRRDLGTAREAWRPPSDVAFRQALACAPIGWTHSGYTDAKVLGDPGAGLGTVLSKVDGAMPFGPFGIGIALVSQQKSGLSNGLAPVAGWLAVAGARCLLLGAGPDGLTLRMAGEEDKPVPLLHPSEAPSAGFSRLAAPAATWDRLPAPARRLVAGDGARVVWSGSFVADTATTLILGGTLIDLDRDGAADPAVTAVALLAKAAGLSAVDGMGTPLLGSARTNRARGLILGPRETVSRLVAALATEPPAPTPLFRHRGLFTR